MTYYAVTNDPNELMHFGIKGMKWGVIRTPEQLGHHKPTKSRSSKPRSPAYLKASAKLSRSMQAGIARAQANWKAYNSPAQKAQRAENRAINKQIRDYKRNERAFQKHLELARQGRLKYKGISDSEVSRITDRLALERSSRLLSGTEKQSFGRRLAERAGEGVIEGVGRGVSGYINERMTGRGRTTAEIKGERRKTRAQFGIRGRINTAMKNQLDDAKYEREQKRADKEERQTAEENYRAAVEANRQLGYDDALGSGSAAQVRLHGYSANRKSIRNLSTAELKGRTTALNDVARLYGTKSTELAKAEVKSSFGAKDTTTTDPETGEKKTETVYPGRTKPDSKKNDAEKGGFSSTEVVVAPRERPTDISWNTRGDMVAYNRPVTRNMVTNYSRASRSSRNKRFERATAGVNTVDEITSEINAQEAARRAERARVEEANRQRQLEQRDLSRRQNAQNEGYSYYAARRESRERAGDIYLPNAPTRAQIENRKRYEAAISSNPYAISAYGKHTHGYTTTRVVSKPMGNGSQYSSSSSVTVTPHPMSKDRSRRRNQSRQRNYV